MKKALIAIVVTLGLILFLSFYFSGSEEEKLQQGRADFLSTVTAGLNEQEVYDIYVFGENGDVSSDYENQVNDIFMEYGGNIKNLTIIPYSETAETPYSDYFEMIEDYPTIIVFSKTGIAFHSESPEQLEHFLSSELGKTKNVESINESTEERVAMVVEIGPTDTEELRLIEDYDKVSGILEALDGFVDWKEQGKPPVAEREGLQLNVMNSEDRETVIDSYQIYFSDEETEEGYIHYVDIDAYIAMDDEQEQVLLSSIEQ
ncbi:hypothetical protein [Planococcus lenghuensis]|uniref:Uncharacterized protein n=1 Tax=Planococcus lenghuensis TaxID=2213202 RepID=A0A1Q2L4E0_9BACL|nr:hypothetical protein [Planococcus lenghuensis]AQQ55244.1 hypothetical protein B0X71_18855 [Planococcus lenghuensis]